MSFIDEFDVVPYAIQVDVGKKCEFKKAPNFISPTNFKGKTVLFYRKAKTAEEFAKYGYDDITEQRSADEVALPIEISLKDFGQRLKAIFSNTSKFTKKVHTHHNINILDSSNKQVGSIDLTLNPSGDITRRHCCYYNADQSKRIYHTVNFLFSNGTVSQFETFEFSMDYGDTTKTVIIFQKDGMVLGGSILEIDSKTRHTRSFIDHCILDELDPEKRNIYLTYGSCSTLESYLLKYKKKEKQFQRFLDEYDLDLSFDDIISINSLPQEKIIEAYGLNFSLRIGYYADIASHLKDEKNNKLKDFKGQYIGNIIRGTNLGDTACIVTKQQKNDQDYRLYTLIDLPYEEFFYDSVNNNLDTADKTPAFVTKRMEDGTEELVLFKGKPVSGRNVPIEFAETAKAEYVNFVRDFIEPLSDIKPVKISQILNKGQNVTR